MWKLRTPFALTPLHPGNPYPLINTLKVLYSVHPIPESENQGAPNDETCFPRGTCVYHGWVPLFVIRG